jgi:PST family polysaccharide transporter
MSDSLARAAAATLNRAWRQWFYAVSVVLGAYLGARYGITGVAAGVSIAILLNFLLMLQLSIALSGVSAQTLLVIHARHLLVATATTLAAYGAMSFARAELGSAVARLLVAGMAAGASWLLVALLLPSLLGDELMWLVSVLKSRLGLMRNDALI